MDFCRTHRHSPMRESSGFARACFGLFTLALSLASWACTVSTEPDTVGTNTSWLKLCSRDAECGEGHCVAYICTLECDPGGRACTSLSPNAECTLQDPMGDTFCDMPCDSDDECADEGTDLVCTDGACRTRGVPVAVSKGFDEVLPAAQEANDPTVRSSHGSLSAAWVNDDHWRVVQEALERNDGEWTGELRVADLRRGGSVRRQKIPLQVEQVFAEQVRVNGFLADPVRPGAETDGSAEECVTPMLDASRATYLRLPCAADEWFAIPGTEDWLALAQSGEAVTLGRYRPSETRWVIPQTEIWWTSGQVEGFTRAGDLWLHSEAPAQWGTLRSGQVARVVGALDAKTKAFPEVIQQRDVSLEPPEVGSEEGYFFWTPGPEGWFTPYRFDEVNTESSSHGRSVSPSGVYLRPMAGNGGVNSPVRFDVGSEAGSKVLGWTVVPEMSLLVFCHADEGPPEAGSRLMVSVFDPRGRLAAPPRELDAHDVDLVWGCALHWSGTELLATWEYNTEIEPGVVSARPGGGAIHAQVIRLDD